MNTKSISTSKLTFIAICGALNIIGGNLALFLKLPFYLDTLGTFFTAALYGPVYGMVPGLISGIFTGITTDIYSFFYLPVQLITGCLAGFFLSNRTTSILYQENKRKTKFYHSIIITAFFITIPGTIVSSCITAFLFGGITSSGSSILVQVFHQAGLSMTASVFLVQIFTDYGDRILMLFLSLCLLKAIPKSTLELLKKKA